MEKLDPPKPMEFEGDNIAAEWKKWRSHLDFYLTAAEKDGESDLELCYTENTVTCGILSSMPHGH